MASGNARFMLGGGIRVMVDRGIGNMHSSSFGVFVKPRRACAARVTVVVRSNIYVV